MTDLTRESDGRWRVKLDSATVTPRCGATRRCDGCRSSPEGRTATGSIAVEPMTCGPDAFNPGPTHDDMKVLAPGETFIGQWGISGR